MFDPSMLQAMQGMGGGGDGGTPPNASQMKDMLKQMGLPEDYMDTMNQDDGKPQMPSFDDDKPMSEITRLLECVSEEHGVLHQEGRIDYFWQLLDDRMEALLSQLPPCPHDQELQAPAVTKSKATQQPQVPAYVDNPYRYPAVDICSGVGVQCVEFAKHAAWRRRLDWVPTESMAAVVQPERYDNSANTKKNNKDAPYNHFPTSRLQQLRSALQYFFDTDNDGPVLAADRLGMALYKNSQVKLCALQRDGYNGRKGKVLGVDPKSSDDRRLGIKLETKNAPISLKPANLERTDGGLKYEEGVQIEQDRQLLDEMKQRACPALVEDIESWEIYLKSSFYGKCALVTYVTVQRGKPLDEENYGMHDSGTDPLALMGQPPNISWRKLLVLANHLLRPGGYLLQYDCASASEHYGNEDLMKEHVANLSLELELVVREIPVDDPNSEDPMISMLWQKS